VILLPLAGAFLLLSGLAALTYQVVWVRLLGLSMGSTAASVSTVLAAFFGGLAVGSALADRLARRHSGIDGYLVLETVIGIGGLLLLPVLLRLDSLVAALPVMGSSLAVKFVVTVVLLSVPTICMGATFPVMADLLARGRADLGRRMSFLYSLNTWGAVAGAGLAGFVLIPRLGLDGAVMVAAACNFAIVAVGFFARSLFCRAEPARSPKELPADAAVTDAPYAGFALTSLVATGFCSIAAEVGWTKYLAIFTGATLYGFATILVVFLAGIALGSWFVRPLLGDQQRTVNVLMWGLVLLGLSVALTRPALSLAPSVLALARDSASAPLLAYGFILVVLLPPTLLFGALFPAGLELYCGRTNAVRRRAGRAYAINTLAGIAGSVTAGFWAIPALGTDRLLAALALVFPLVAIAAASMRSAAPTASRRRVLGAAVVAAAVTIALPGLDYEPLVRAVSLRDPSAAGSDPAAWRFAYLREARAGVVSVITRDGAMGALQTNGLTESHLNFVDPMAGSPTESLLGLVPYLVHSEPRDAFIVGFGGGNTAFSLTRAPELSTIRVVELEPAIVDAVRTTNQDFVPALLDPRVDLEFNDARNALLVEGDLYDIVVSQPSHPWLAGSGTLFTREFFEIVNARLRAGGVFGQWVNLFNMDAVTLGAILKSFYEVFPYGFALRPSGGRDLLVFGSQQPLILDPVRLAARLRHRELADHLARQRVATVSDLLRDFAFSRTEILLSVQTGPANTDTNLISEVRLARMGGGGGDPASVEALLSSARGFDVLPHLVQESAPLVLDDLAKSFHALGRSGDARAVEERRAQIPPQPRRLR
jgi:spermidine synthase